MKFKLLTATILFVLSCTFSFCDEWINTPINEVYTVKQITTNHNNKTFYLLANENGKPMIGWEDGVIYSNLEATVTALWNNITEYDNSYIPGAPPDFKSTKKYIIEPKADDPKSVSISYEMSQVSNSITTIWTSLKKQGSYVYVPKDKLLTLTFTNLSTWKR